MRIIIVLLLLSGWNHIWAEQAPLTFGLLPSESAMSKFRRYAPLREYLTQKLGREVLLETARNFPAFKQRAESRVYDFLETAPHFVIPIIEKGGYEVITTITVPLTAQVVVRNDSNIQTLRQLAGTTIATPSPKAIITRLGKELFAQLGLPEASQPEFETYPTHNAAYQAVLGKQAEAAVISVNVYNKAVSKGMPLRSIAQSREIPNMSILVAADLPASLKKKLKAVLVNMKEDPDGKAVLKSMAYPGYRAASREEYEALQAYLQPSAK